MVLVIGVVDRRVGLACGLAFWLNLFNIIAAWESLRGDVVSALRHGVVEAEFAIAEVSSTDDSAIFEPFPWGSNLSTIAAH